MANELPEESAPWLSEIAALSTGGWFRAERGGQAAAGLRQILDALPAAIYTTDAEGRLTFFNRAAVEFSGRRPQLGTDRWCVSWRLYRPDGTALPHEECPMAVALKTGRPVRGEEAIIERPDGSRVHFQPYPTPLYDESGRLIGGVNMLVDITDRKRAEEARKHLNDLLERRVDERTQQAETAVAELHRSEEWFRILVQGVTDHAIFMLDPQGYVTNWNTGAQRIKGYTADEIVGRHFSVFYTEEDRRAGLPATALERAARQGRFEYEGWRVRKDGSRFLASIVIDPIRNDSGELIGFAKVTRDITERRAAQEALRASEQRFRLLVQGVIDYAIFMIDPDGIVAAWNAGAERINGYKAEEILGRHFSVFYTEQDRRNGVPEAVLERARRTGKNEVEGWRVRKDGSTFWASVVLDAIRDEDGQLVGFAKITRDLTEKRAAEEQLRLAQKMEAIGQLTGGVAHDFNNLLTAIIGNLEMLAASLPERGSKRRLAEAALRAAMRGARLTEQLLAYSRKDDIRAERVNASQLLGETMLLCQKTVGEGIELVPRLADDLWTCHVDPAQLEAAVLNLASNARDAMNRKGRLVVATENATIPPGDPAGLPPGDYVVVSVADTGCGMSPEVLARAFEPFYTTKEVGKGTGLGLSQVYGFARQSGGAARIDSRPGGGTTVWLYLPRIEGEPSATGEPGAAAAPPGHETILVAEDDPDVREALVGILTGLGYRVLTCGTADEALAVLRRDRGIDLLFSDVVMPGGLSGVDLARAARRLRPELKILLGSGFAGDSIGEIRRQFPFIAKPLQPAALACKVRHVLGSPLPAEHAAD